MKSWTLRIGSTTSDQVQDASADQHVVLTTDGQQVSGSWDEIVRSLRDSDIEGLQDRTTNEFMARVSKRAFRERGVRVPHHDAESFVRASADAGILRLVR